MNGSKATNDIHYIFYLQLAKKLPKYFFTLSDLFAEWDIKLIPITPKQLTEVAKHEKKFVLTLVREADSHKLFCRLFRDYFNLSIKTGRTTLVHLSSYSKSEFKGLKSNRAKYMFFPLPVNMLEVVAQVAYQYYKNGIEEKRWPGGRKGHLPPALDSGEDN
jgi:hypothetical protein